MTPSKPPSRFDLSGRLALVTGANGRLGPVWISALLEAGAEVYALDVAGRPLPAALAELQAAYPDRVHPLAGDVRSRGDLEKARAEVRKKGRLSVLVNNAGIDQPPGPVAQSFRFEDIPAQLVRDTFEVNFIGALQVVQVFGPDLAESGRGAVINIGSLYASVAPDQRLYEHLKMEPPFLKPPAYGASKAALINLTRFLAAHWAPQGVRVNALSPGGVEGGQDPDFKAKYHARVPMGRMAAFTDLSGPLVFLASDASSYMTGQELVIDGGFTAW